MSNCHHLACRSGHLKVCLERKRELREAVRSDYSIVMYDGSRDELDIITDERMKMEGENKIQDSTNPKDLLGVKKVPLHLVPPSSLIYEAVAFRDGAKKYGPYNWRSKKVSAVIYIDAALRHIQAYLDGEDNAFDSGLPHLAHAKATLGVVIDALETGNLVDDRPPKGAAARLLERFKEDK